MCGGKTRAMGVTPCEVSLLPCGLFATRGGALVSEGFSALGRRARAMAIKRGPLSRALCCFSSKVVALKSSRTPRATPLNRKLQSEPSRSPFLLFFANPRALVFCCGGWRGIDTNTLAGALLRVTGRHVHPAHRDV